MLTDPAMGYLAFDFDPRTSVFVPLTETADWPIETIAFVF